MANAKPKWYQLRWKLSKWFVRIARKIYPKNPDVTAFYEQAMTDQFIYGQWIVRIDPAKMRPPNARHKPRMEATAKELADTVLDTETAYKQVKDERGI